MSINSLILLSLIFSIFLIVYHHAGYPIILRLLRNVRSQSTTKYLSSNSFDSRTPLKTSAPSFTILVPAYNEEKHIKEKLNNLVCQDYPCERFRIIVACDGCTDETVNIAKETVNQLEHTGVDIQIIEFHKNQGKCAIINTILEQINTDLVAFSDVSSLISFDALSISASRFEDKTVGGINGNYRILHPNNAGEKNYWKYQRNIKLGEQALGSILGAHGAFYVIRTNLFKALPIKTINDDFIIPMRVIEQGYKVIFDERINAVEMEKSNCNDNWRRRTRIGFGNTQQILALKNLFLPRYSGVAFAFFSGKGLRVAMPFLMIYSFMTSLYCSFYWPEIAVLFLVQLAIYTIALWSELHSRKPLGKLTSTVHYIVSGHTANMIGTLNFFLRSKTEW